ncbi:MULTISPECIES: MarR family winged helix-turn-helix transcriptional regulator [unclassified Saccharopolyspora]|uniref:MarR family winged helix-turn-helix transcriptional regulator n=1 Tax=unclassified Saccharopolyspora TaxID=2646250 RepID=UPI001CD35EAF|nr:MULTISPECIES: MarR family transcriptional regulator [unclassified Saccharopolyspora]MCA1189309.1 MarR family transcriptional regulator [Saccharopolyspora sp. 6T]MCA1195301.1 MarR family transcriptional regulator [Saccharopolyspora sp. 6V]MCA1229127.1 MarR family transcriptional regulator [Saccharopolyspora sp. 6M]MCA1283007.1 MarR family transcriptional regulator [Saccharopolyspora sp. 7B]
MEPPIESQVLELLHQQGVEGERISQAFAARHGMHPTDVRALILIIDAEQRGTPATPRALRQDLVLTSGAVTAIVDRLEARRHVRRSREGSDRRQVQLHPTESARAIAGEYFGALAGRGREVLSEFDAAELAVVHRFLHRMQQAMRDFAAGSATEPAPEEPAGSA